MTKCAGGTGVPKAADAKPGYGPAPRRPARVPSQIQARSVVPLWFYMASVVVLLLAAVGLTVKFKMDQLGLMDKQKKFKEEHDLQVTGYEADIDGLVKETAGLKEEIDAQRKELALQRRVIAEVRAEKKQIEARIPPLEQKIAAAEKARDGLQADVKRLTDENASVTAALAAEKEATKGVLDQVAAAKAAADREAQRAQAELNQRVALQSELEDLKAQVQYLKTEKIPELEAEIEYLIKLVPEDKLPQ
ncbi:MAG: hypothetical protein ABIF71_03770 [Planctomycetota bacterium]